MSEFYGNGSDLPRVHPDNEIDLEAKVQALCGALDTARKALAAAAAMQVVQPSLEEIKTNAAWAMRETEPATVFAGDLMARLVIFGLLASLEEICAFQDRQSPARPPTAEQIEGAERVMASARALLGE